MLWLIKKDKHNRFLFSASQLPAAEKLIRQYNIDSTKTESVILISEGKVYIKSDAALRILLVLGGIYKAAAVFYTIPRIIRNYIYDFVAVRRYRWFGQRSSCFIPGEQNKSKFLQ